MTTKHSYTDILELQALGLSPEQSSEEWCCEPDVGAVLLLNEFVSTVAQAAIQSHEMNYQLREIGVQPLLYLWGSPQGIFRAGHIK